MKLLGKKALHGAVLVLLISISGRVAAQTTLNADAVKAELIKEWQRSKAYTDAYLNTMPADKYGFKAVDSIRSFAQQMLHLASGTFFLMNKATGAQSPVMGMVSEQRASAQTKDSVVYYVNASYDYAIDAVTKLDAAKLGETIDAFGNKASRLILIMKGIEHQAHHRGQTTIYIRLQGIRPPNEQLF